MTAKSILLVEDDADSSLFVRFALKRLQQRHRLQHASCASTAMSYLKAEGQFADRSKYPLPDLVLLDLKMPGMDGFELLEWIRSQPSLKRVPVCVMTTSTYSLDLAKAYNLGADYCISKPVDLFVFVEALKSVLDKFLTTCVDPHEPWTDDDWSEDSTRMQAA